ncbi:MAG TPA: hypothetical protein VJZ92_00980 [Thermodesulfobacteriota bacterium]|nr:hypothetical protein [Thermodesulfobacteriota bacterium]
MTKSLDLDESDIKKLSLRMVKKFAKKYPGDTQKYLDRLIPKSSI